MGDNDGVATKQCAILAVASGLNRALCGIVWQGATKLFQSREVEAPRVLVSTKRRRDSTSLPFVGALITWTFGSADESGVLTRNVLAKVLLSSVNRSTSTKTFACQEGL